MLLIAVLGIDVANLVLIVVIFVYVAMTGSVESMEDLANSTTKDITSVYSGGRLSVDSIVVNGDLEVGSLSSKDLSCKEIIGFDFGVGRVVCREL